METGRRRVEPNRKLLILLLCLGLCPIVGPEPGVAAGSATFRYHEVVAMAQKLSEESYRPPSSIPDFLLGITYDAWRDIRFDPEQALWKKENLPFTVQFFHPGFYYERAVKIHVIEAGRVTDVVFTPDLFTYGRNDFRDRVPADLGFAGFRLHYPIKTKDYQDEVLVFLGASYLRAVGRDHHYGMSARALAVDTATNSGEEFPFFREFWIVKPTRKDTEATVLALLDSPSVTGAFRYVIQPGEMTVLRVFSTVFLRKKVSKLGIGPMTSMFFYGENVSRRPVDDFRPEIHDSDGLMIAFGSGEWLWRPLLNPKALQICSFEAPSPVGFGLVQRDQNFDHYQDLESRYDARPSVWITPAGSWGDGHVELIGIPTDSELNDNISAYWVPREMPDPGKPATYSYTMRWYSPSALPPPGGWVVGTRVGRGKQEGSKKFVIDFVGRGLEALPSDTPLAAVITLDERTRLLEQQLYKNRVTGGWRLVFQIQIPEPASLDLVLPNRPRPLELRAFLRNGDDVLTETWSYAFEP
jgi:periplasmic glucans biosynthesis protein